MWLDTSYELTEISLSGEESNCTMEMNLKYDECLQEKVPKKLQEIFNCSVPFIPSDVDSCDPHSSRMKEVIEVPVCFVILAREKS